MRALWLALNVFVATVSCRWQLVRAAPHCDLSLPSTRPKTTLRVATLYPHCARLVPRVQVALGGWRDGALCALRGGACYARYVCGAVQQFDGRQLLRAPRRPQDADDASNRGSAARSLPGLRARFRQHANLVVK